MSVGTKAVLALTALAAALTPPVEAQLDSLELGKIDFPTSRSGQAQSQFLRGVAALHSFWYPEALDAFREVTRTDPDFMMGYWGEAMSHNHPIWQEQDTELGRNALAKVRPVPGLTAREQAYLDAVKVLYSEGTKHARDLAYAEAMRKLHQQYPADPEGACFYALALLGTVRPTESGVGTRMKAAAIALEVFSKNPNHPGAAHYVIHAFDDPEHAILALPAAQRYARIAPAAPHARHMPSHIFVQLGMWPEAAASNESAWAASADWVRQKQLPLSRRDYHSYSWLEYVYLQQGRLSEAEALLADLRKLQSTLNEPRLRATQAMITGHWLVETGRWEMAESLLKEMRRADQPSNKPNLEAQEAVHCGAPSTPKGTSSRRGDGSRTATFVLGLSAAEKGRFEEAEQARSRLRAVRAQSEKEDAEDARALEVMQLEITAAAASKRGDEAEAIDAMKRATGIEEAMAPPSGPPTLFKPSHELFGEILLRFNRPKEAAEQFATALARQPNRTLALLGSARAAARLHDGERARTAYQQLLQIWGRADKDLPGLKEATEYLRPSAQQAKK